MGAGEGSNDGASAHPRNGSSNPRVVAHQPPARRTKPADETSTRARLTPASPPPPSLTWEQHDAFHTYPPTRPGARTSSREIKTSDLDALYRAVEREQRRFLAHVAEAARGVCASMGARDGARGEAVGVARRARRVDPKTGDAPGYGTPARRPSPGPACSRVLAGDGFGKVGATMNRTPRRRCCRWRAFAAPGVRGINPRAGRRLGWAGPSTRRPGRPGGAALRTSRRFRATRAAAGPIRRRRPSRPRSSPRAAEGFGWGSSSAR